MLNLPSPDATYSANHKRAKLVYTYFTGSPMWCAWQVTYRCNFRCRFCSYWDSPEKHSRETTVEEFAQGARKLARMGTVMISLAGGEPLVRQDIVDVVREVSRYHITFVTTNGWLMTDELARRLFEAGLWGVSVSMDYAEAARHDEARGVTGAWERAVRALEACARARTDKHQRVNLMSVLMHDNLEDMDPLCRLAARLGVNFMVQPYSPMKTGDRRFLPPVGSAEHLVELKRRHRNFLSNIEFLKQFDHARNGGVPGCRAGRSFFNIDQRGDIARCVEHRDEVLANLVDDDIDVIRRELRASYDPTGCRACWYNCRGEIESIYNLRGALESLRTLVSNPLGD